MDHVRLPSKTGVSEPGSPFDDVRSSQYFYQPVKWAVANGITTGTSAATFSPDQTCTRGQIITFLWRAAGSPEPENATPFSDVKEDAYYAKATAWAAEQGMEEGAAFSPDAPCTRLMAVEFMWEVRRQPRGSQSYLCRCCLRCRKLGRQAGRYQWHQRHHVLPGTEPAPVGRS